MPPLDDDEISDALAESLGAVVAQKTREFDRLIGEYATSTRALLAEKWVEVEKSKNQILQSQLDFAAQKREHDEIISKRVALLKDGEKGETGDPGPAGDPGKDGAPGDKGDPGEPGPQGEPGPIGETGQPGDPGQKGDPGQPGRDGEPPSPEQVLLAFQDYAETLKRDYAIVVRRECFDLLTELLPAALGDQIAKYFEANPVPAGRDGDPGPRGDKGDRGDDGEPGARGDKGDTGDRGDKGDPGDRGEDGAPGQKGEDGAPGQKGEDGAAGQKGDPGEIGDPGLQGDKGEDGAPGQKGDPGDRGDPGNPGLQGEPGQKGDDGAPGQKGDPGDGGPRGDVGDPGPQGDPGQKGDPGDRGDKGDDGVPGQKGDPGIDGVNFSAVQFAEDSAGRAIARYVDDEGTVKEQVLVTVNDRGFYRYEGTYLKGDVVGWGGSSFLARRDVKERESPDDERVLKYAKEEGDERNSNAPWRLLARHGRDGKNNSEKRGPSGPVKV